MRFMLWQVTFSKESYLELTVGFTLVELSYEEFSTWLHKARFFRPNILGAPGPGSSPSYQCGIVRRF